MIKGTVIKVAGITTISEFISFRSLTRHVPAAPLPMTHAGGARHLVLGPPIRVSDGPATRRSNFTTAQLQHPRPCQSPVPHLAKPASSPSLRYSGFPLPFTCHSLAMFPTLHFPFPQLCASPFCPCTAFLSNLNLSFQLTCSLSHCLTDAVFL